MNLDIESWKPFAFGNLIDEIYKAKAHAKVELAISNEMKGEYVPFVSRTENDNCVDCYAFVSDLQCTEEGNAIVIGDTTSTISYQPKVFGTGDHIIVIRASWLNEYTGLFIVGLLQKERFRYSYGRAFLINLIKTTIIWLPIQRTADGVPCIDETHKFSPEGYIPDWEWMENYIKSLNHKPIKTKNKHDNALTLDLEKWKKFKIGNLFEVQLSKGDIKLDDMDKGNIPLVSSGETHNGIVGFIDDYGDGKAEIFSGNKLTVDMFGNPFYQPDDFYAVSHGRVNILVPRFELTKNIGLFIASIIRKEQYKYSYGRAVYSSVASEMEIVLPIQRTTEGIPRIDETNKYSSKGYIPDWEWMENYIKSLPYSDRI